jgi:GNAT superfamily N-acetyltransferase
VTVRAGGLGHPASTLFFPGDPLVGGSRVTEIERRKLFVSLELLRPDDYEALAAHLGRLCAETDCLGMRFFHPYTGAQPDADDTGRRANRLSRWARPIGEPGWRRLWGARTVEGAPVIAHLELTGPDLEIKQHRAQIALGVEAAFRRQGLGEKLLREAIAFARDKGLAWLDLWVFAHNAPALALYRKTGFVEAGRFEDEFRIGGLAIEDVALVLRL